jgi:hypothetical protein
MKKKPPEKKKPPPTWRNWRNIVTLATFFLFVWPISLIVMWFLATWNKKTKWAVTLFFVLVLLAASLASLSAPFFVPLGMASFLKLAQLVYSFCSSVAIVSLIVALVLSFKAKKKNQPTRKIWLVSSLFIGFAILVGIFFAQATAALSVLSLPTPP